MGKAFLLPELSKTFSSIVAIAYIQKTSNQCRYRSQQNEDEIYINFSDDDSYDRRAGLHTNTTKRTIKKTASMEQITSKGYTTFQVSDNITMYKVTFKNQYKMDVAGHLFIPKNSDRSKKIQRSLLGILWER
ncbi:MAG: hypothetical protein PUP90_21735 [Nostoc sp. S4]|nr:hypothetical protein [Nostoc sp. S4]